MSANDYQVSFQRQDFFLGQFGVASYECRLKPILEHGLGGFSTATYKAFSISISNRGIVIIQIFHISLIFSKFPFIKIRNFHCLNPDTPDLSICPILPEQLKSPYLNALPIVCKTYFLPNAKCKALCNRANRIIGSSGFRQKATESPIDLFF